MKIWFDTEFRENGATIELISIGAVLETGHTFYVENADFTFNEGDVWLLENVEPYLNGPKLPYAEIGPAFLAWVHRNTNRPEFWAYYASYDWVALCQLYGRMIDLPQGFPMWCRDLKQLMEQEGVRRIPVENMQAHNALADAMWTKRAYEWMKQTYDL